MRRLTTKRQLWLERRAYSGSAFQRRRAGWARQRRLSERRRPITERPLRIEAPEKLVTEREEDRQLVMRCLDAVETALSQGKQVNVRFTKTSRLFPGGTLIFVSTLLRLAAQYPGRLAVSYPNDEIVEELLQHIGFLPAFGLPARRLVSAENVRHWHYVTGQKADVSQLEGLVQQYMGHLPENANADLYGCLCEAILNVSYHAYPGAAPSASEPRWWMFAQQRDGRLFVAVYDSGIGIPESLRQRPEFLEQFGQAMTLDSRRYDHKLLAKAIESRRSSTGRPNQGKGLPEMLSFATGAAGGKFYALSGHGEFRYDEARGGKKSKHSKYGLKGTLVIWSLPLRGDASATLEGQADGTASDFSRA